MYPSPNLEQNFFSSLFEQLPIGLIVHSAGGEMWVNPYLSQRHPSLRQEDVSFWPNWIGGWLDSGSLESPLLHLDDELYQIEHYEIGDDRVLVCWPSAAVAKFAPQVKQLEQMYHDFREIYRNSFDGIFITDGEGRTLMVNDGCERNYGAPASEFIGKHVSEFETSGLIRPVIATKVIETRKKITAVQETRIGKTIMVTGIPLLDEAGNVRKVVINSRDTTELIQLQEALAHAHEKLHRYELEVNELRMGSASISGVTFRSNSMKDIATVAMRVAKVSTTVLITGESGVGKEVLARLIHKESPRKNNLFVKINCGAIPHDLLESELFGYQGGAFTGAQRQGKIGLFEVANNGTLFLDEIGELSLDLQVKLLQVLQDKTLVRLGSTRLIQVDVRVIAATNRDLQEMVNLRTFRSDLFYRLNVVPLHVPPLRERREDILPLVQQFLDELNTQYSLKKAFSEQALAILHDYQWPGNVRELHNMIERLVVTTSDVLIRTDSLPTSLLGLTVSSDESGLSMKSKADEFERKLVREAVQNFGSTRAAAKHLKISQSTVVRRMKE
jgi:PAS domain S-box-containing protein